MGARRRYVYLPSYVLFGGALVVVGVAAQTFTATTLGTVQMSTDPAMRGRDMAILLAIALGGTPIGAPIVGYVADRFGARWALGVGAAAGFTAALVGIAYLRSAAAAAREVARVTLTAKEACLDQPVQKET